MKSIRKQGEASRLSPWFYRDKKTRRLGSAVAWLDSAHGYRYEGDDNGISRISGIR